MLRAFTIATRKLLLPRPFPVHTSTSDAASSTSTVNNEDRQSNRVANHHKSGLPLATDHHGHRLLGQNGILTNQHIRCASAKKGFQVPDPQVIACNMINMLKCIDLKDMKDSPPPMFWVTLATGGAQVVIPFLEIIGGYSDLLTILQLHIAALTVAYYGGVQWGLANSKNPKLPPNWDTMKKAITPTMVAILGLILPYPLGFLTVGAAMVSRLYIDLKSCIYPAWGLASRVFLAVTTLSGLFMALIAYLLFHSEDKKKKNKKTKDSATQVEEEEDDNEKEDESNSNKKDKSGK